MKMITKTLLSLAISTMSIGGAVGLGIAANNERNENPMVAEAGVVSNTYYLRLGSDWNSANAKYSVYAYGGTGGTKWYPMSVSDSTYQVYSANVTAAHDNLIFVRFNPEAAGNTWSDVWGQTEDLNPNSYNYFKVNDSITGSKYGGSWMTYKSTVESYIMGLNGDWSTQSAENQLSLNGTQYEITKKFTQNQTFKVVRDVHGCWDYHGFDAIETGDGSARSAGYVINDSGNIKINTAGTYSIYLKSNGKIWMQKASASSEAYSFASYFLANIGCDYNGINRPSGWGAVSDKYDELSPEAKALVVAASAVKDSEDDLQNCMYVYEWALGHNPNLSAEDDYIGRLGSGSVETKQKVDLGTNYQIIALLSITSVALIAAAFYFLKKKKLSK